MDGGSRGNYGGFSSANNRNNLDLMPAAAHSTETLYKIMIVGDTAVGKSSIMNRFTDNYQPTKYVATIGVDFKVKRVNLEKDTIKLQIWDTAGQEKFRTITSQYYRGTQGVILVYDVTSKASFDSLASYWFNSIKPQVENESVFILVGNKKDDVENRIISEHEGRNLAESLNAHFFEVSAKEDEGEIAAMFLELSESMHKCFKNSDMMMQFQAGPNATTNLVNPGQNKDLSYTRLYQNDGSEGGYLDMCCMKFN